MYLTRSDYDRSVSVYSPDGRLYQVEYSILAAKLGSTAVGIRTSEGVVLAVEKRIISPLMVTDSIEKIVEVDNHIGAAMSGLTADARTLIDHARVESQNHRFTFDEPLNVSSCCQAVCDLALKFGERNSKERIMSRPFGVALLIGGIDERGPSLFHTDPSGTYIEYQAKAIGAGSEGAQTTLQEKYNRSMSLGEAEVLALTTLRQVMEEKISKTNVEVASITPHPDDPKTGQYRLYSVEEVDQLLQSLPASDLPDLG